MRRLIFYFSLITILIIPAKGFSSKLEVKKLSNGFTVLLDKNNQVPLIVMQLWVGHGSIDEKDDEAGLAHFLEHLTFRSKDIAKRIEELGGDINAYTTFDRTVYYLTLSKDYYEEGVKVLYDIFKEASFEDKSFNEEKKVVIEEMKRGYDNPQRMLYYKFFETALKNHPARRPVIGYEKTIENTDREKVYQFYKRFYDPKSSFLVISGDFDEHEILKIVERVFGKTSTKDDFTRPLFKLEEAKDAPEISFKTMDINSCYIMLGVPTPGIGDPQIPAIDVMSYILGESPTSILNLKLKEQLQLVNYIYSYQMSLKDLGFFVVQANMSCNNVEKATHEIINILFKKRITIKEDELKKVLKNYESNYFFSREKLSDRAGDIGHSYFYFNEPDYSKKYIELIRNVKIEDIINVQERFLNLKNMTYTIVMPETDKKKIEDISRVINKFVTPIESFRTFTLPNGIQVLLNYRPQNPTFGISILSFAGTRIEDFNTSGLSNFTISNILRGTKNYTYQSILNKLEMMGGSLSGVSTKNISGIKGKFLSRDFDEALMLVADILSNFNPPHEEVEKVRKLIIADIKKKQENPNRVIRDLYLNNMFGNVPPGLPTEGTEDTVSKFTLEDVKAHFRRIFNPQNLVIAFSGDLPFDSDTKIKDVFSSIVGEKGGYCNIIKVNPIKEKVLENSEFNQSHIMIGFPVPGMSSEENIYFRILATVLSNQSGRLFTNLRDKEGLAYSLGAFLYEFPENSLFTLYMGTSPEKTDRALKGLLDELEKVIVKGIDDEELLKAKRQIITDIIQSMQENLEFATLLSQNMLIYGDPFYHREIEKKIKNITKEEVLGKAKKYINIDRSVKVILQGKIKNKK